MSRMTTQQYLCIARRRGFLVHIIHKFENHFGYSLCKIEKEELAVFLKLERSEIHESYTQYTSSDNQRTKHRPKSHRDLEKNKKHIQSTHWSDSPIKRGKLRKGKSEEGGKSQIENELRWLDEEWKSIVKILRQREPHSNWDDDY